MKLRELTDVIRGMVPITIYHQTEKIFNGAMCSVSKDDWDAMVGQYLDLEVVCINHLNGTITISVW